MVVGGGDVKSQLRRGLWKQGTMERRSKRGSPLAPSFYFKGQLLSVEAIVTAAPILIARPLPTKVLHVGNRDYRASKGFARTRVIYLIVSFYHSRSHIVIAQVGDRRQVEGHRTVRLNPIAKPRNLISVLVEEICCYEVGELALNVLNLLCVHFIHYRHHWPLVN